MLSALKWQVAQWFELRWWKNYLRGKSKAEYLSWKKNYWQKVLAEANEMRPQPQQTVADLGCGPAGIFIALPDNQVTAVDPLLDNYEKHLTFFDRSDYPNVTFINNGLEQFTSPEKFDVVFCMNAINHVHDMNKCFDMLADLVKPNGYVWLSIDAHNYSFFKTLFRIIPGDVLHPQQHDLKEYEQFLEKRGMKILKTVLLKEERLFNHYLLIAAKGAATTSSN